MQNASTISKPQPAKVNKSTIVEEKRAKELFKAQKAAAFEETQEG